MARIARRRLVLASEGSAATAGSAGAAAGLAALMAISPVLASPALAAGPTRAPVAQGAPFRTGPAPRRQLMQTDRLVVDAAVEGADAVPALAADTQWHAAGKRLMRVLVRFDLGRDPAPGDSLLTAVFSESSEEYELLPDKPTLGVNERAAHTTGREAPFRSAVLPITPEAAPGGHGVFSQILAPGGYRLVLVARDGKGNVRARSVLPLQIPAPEDGDLRITSMYLARAIAPFPGDPPPHDTVTSQVTIGKLALEVGGGNRIARGSNPELLMLTEGKIAASGQVPLTPEYIVRRGDEVVKRFSAPPFNGPLQVQPLPLAALAPQSYQLEVVVRGESGQAEARRALDFVIE